MGKSHIRVLLVEDQPADVMVLEAALEQVNRVAFQVTVVELLDAALCQLRTQPFDVVLLDLGLPDSQGLATFTRLHAIAPAIPVVVLSGLHDEELAAEAVRAGAQDYLVKGQGGSELLVRAIRYAIERYRLQAQLRVSEQYFRALIEHSVDAIATLSADGTISYESPAMFRILGYHAEEVIGQSAFTWLHPDDLAPNTALFQQLLQHPEAPVSTELRYQHKDGSWCWLEATGTNLLDTPGVEAIVVNYRDVTARKHAEEALHQLTETLEQRVAARTAELSQANAELARAARLKDEFLANMSHELRTPLNAILGRAELLQERVYGSLEERQVEALRSIDASGRHLLALINEILDLAKSEAGTLQIERVPVPVAEVCALSMQMVSERAQRKHLALTTTCDPQVTTIPADPQRLAQILINLLANAIKFTPADGAVGLEVAGNLAQQSVTFTVWDTGIGIAAADLARLFQPFTQIDSGLNRQYEGAGLGLALVQRLTQAQGGSVAVTSTPGQGSRFSVILPWPDAQAAASAAAPAGQPQGDVAGLSPAHASGIGASVTASPPATTAPTKAERPCILIVEDHAEQAQVLVDYLTARGYPVCVAAHGGDALLVAQQRPALVLMDIQLPGLDGLEVIRRIRADGELCALPIIALTALALPGDRERCLAAGATAYLAKPVSLPALLTMITTLLGHASEPGVPAARAVP